MKIVYSIALFAVCVISASQAHEARGPCNPDETSDQCVQRYAKENEGTCTQILAGENEVIIQGCGSVDCDETTRKTPEDLSKPYPECCSFCASLLPPAICGPAPVD
ncbi:uncharacterized protein LOC106660184 [Trichogramma pretiosum]|uniref:uncharacterized protein LOC106660184 n=1 Tax=Trichogramma pretiosum TaxID=7493 RepID=UPI000C7190AB|nr:uncharacterized protein LOC106660184 [Trichogramma pretiosum]